MAFVQCDIFSYELGMDTELTVLLPEKRQQKPIDRSNQRYKVLYLLHGHGDDHTAYIRKSLIELLVRDKDLVVVMPNCHRGMYTDGIYTHRYYSYVAEELPIVTANLFHGSLEPKDQYIAGFSMGGYGAAKIALRNPGRYAAVGVLSGGMDMEDHMVRGTGGHFTVPDMEPMHRTTVSAPSTWSHMMRPYFLPNSSPNSSKRSSITPAAARMPRS